jgi:hypothetical protein
MQPATKSHFFRAFNGGLTMKSLIMFGAIALIGSSFASTAYAQKSKREKVVATCVAEAQSQIPASGNPNDPGFNQRYNVYATCMKKYGQRP